MATRKSPYIMAIGKYSVRLSNTIAPMEVFGSLAGSAQGRQVAELLPNGPRDAETKDDRPFAAVFMVECSCHRGCRLGSDVPDWQRKHIPPH